MPPKWGANNPKCPTCGKSVYAAEEVKGPGGKSWHTLCFCCKKCGKSMRGGEWTDSGGDPYCKSCHGKSFGPKGIGFGTLGDTGVSAKPIETISLTHDECTSVKEQLGACEHIAIATATATSCQELGQTTASPSKPTGFQAPSAPKCPTCSKSVYAAEEVKGPGGNSWHTSCFCCKGCNKSIRGGEWSDNDGDPYCKACHGKAFGPKGIGFGTLGDTSVPANLTKGNAEQPEKRMSMKERMSTFEQPRAESSGVAAPSTQAQPKPLASKPRGFQPVSAPKCFACGKSVFAVEEVKGPEGNSWHALCFCCKGCGKSMRGGEWRENAGQPYCASCHGKCFGPKGIGFGNTLGDTGHKVGGYADGNK